MPRITKRGKQGSTARRACPLDLTDRWNRLRRRPTPEGLRASTRPAAGPRASLPDPVGTDDRMGERRRPRRRLAPACHERRPHRLLPHPFDGDPGTFRRARSRRRPALRRGRPGVGRRTHHLPRRAGRGPRSLRAPRQSTGSRAHPARVGRARDRVPRVDHRRSGKPFLRDRPLARRQAARHDHPAMGDDPGPAHRHRRRRRVPPGGRAAGGGRHLRNRGDGPGVVRGAHEGVRAAERMPAPADPGPGPEPRALGPLAPPDGAPVRAGRPRLDRRSPERDRGPEPGGAVAVQGPPAASPRRSATPAKNSPRRPPPCEGRRRRRPCWLSWRCAWEPPSRGRPRGRA